MAKATFANAQTGAGTKICEEKHLKFRFSSAIIGVQRVAFLRKSSCRAATRFFAESGEKWQDGRKLHRQIV